MKKLPRETSGSPVTRHPSLLYKTGDLARWLPDGNIQFLGRIDNQLKIEGIRIEPGEIENNLLKHEDIKEAAVVLKEVNGNNTKNTQSTTLTDKERNNHKQLYAYVISEKKLTASGLKEFLLKQLPRYMLPLRFFQLEKMPMSANGKIDRKLLISLDIITNKEIRFTNPSTKMEMQMAGIWSRVLGIEQKTLSVDANFFEIGGNSLKATILISNIHKEFDIKLSLPEFYTTPTIKNTAAHIKKLKKEKYASIEPVEKREYYLLSSAQKRLYILQQIEGVTTAYNMPQVLVIEQKINKEKLEKALKKLIDQHETFRTSFHLHSQEAVQKIHEAVAFKIEYQHAKEEHSDEIIKSFVRPFDLDKAPLLRVGMVELSPTKHIWMIDIHHIISDGTSHQILTHDFATCYEGKELPPPGIQYKDFSQWQNINIQKGALKKQEEFWLNILNGEIPILDLPTDYPRPALQDFDGEDISFELESKETQLLKELTLEEGLTVFMVLLAVFNVLLSKICRQQDIIIGVPLAGRRHADLEKVIGMFLSTLALRNYPTPGKTFKEFLAEVKRKTLEAFDNQDYPFEKLVENAHIARDPSRNPLYSVMLIFQNYYIPGFREKKEEEIPGLKFRQYKVKNLEATNDITLYAEEVGERLVFWLQYCARLFNLETIKRFINCFKKIITAVTANPDQKIAAIEIISEEEKRKILKEFNNTKKGIVEGKSYGQLFEEQVMRSPNSIAAIDRRQQITYNQLNREAGYITHFFKEHSAVPVFITALYIKRGIEMLAAIIGVFKLGGAYLPLEMDYPQERIQEILEDSKALNLITTKKNKTAINQVCTSLPALENILCLEHGIPVKNVLPVSTGNNWQTPVTAVSPNNLAYIIYTSGSTGNPKGVMIHQKGMINHLYAKINELMITRDDIIAQTAPSCFDISVWQYLSPLLVGGKTCIIDKKILLEPWLFLQVLQKQEITILESVPSLLTAFLGAITNKIDKRLNHLRWMILTGEAISTPLVIDWFKNYPGIKIVNAYGPTEASDDVTHYIIDKSPAANQATIPIGKPIQNLHIYILDDHLLLCPPGVRGEICVAGIGVGNGYLKDPVKTTASFIPNPYLDEIGNPDYAVIYKTGDIGYFREDGNIECLGRKDNQVKIRGYRIELGEIENQLLNHPGIKETVVIDKEIGSGSKFLCAYWVAAGPDQPGESEIRDYLSRKLPEYMIPSYFTRMENIPLTGSGKIDRKHLPEPRGNENAQEYETPLDADEKKLRRIWSKLLGVKKERISVKDNFFELGGHSLTATVMMSAILEEFHVKVPLVNIFKTPTIKGLIKYIKTAHKETSIPIVPVEEKEIYELSINQERLWILQEKNPGSTSYHLSQQIIMEHDVDKEAVKKSLYKILERHETLRTGFREINGKVYQFIEKNVEFPLKFFDFTSSEETGIEQKKEQIFREIAGTRFNFSQAPLCRAALIKWNQGTYELICHMHHIISDGWSMELLRNDFFHFYQGFKTGKTVEPEPVKIQYKDFSTWHNYRMTNSLQKEKSLQYWRKILEEGFPVMNLPVDFNRKSTDLIGAGYRCTLSKNLKEDLKKLARGNNTTLSMVLFTTYKILLSYLLDQEFIACSIISAGREQKSLYNTMGFFVNSVIVKCHIDREATFTDILRKVEYNTLEAFQHQDYPLELLLEELKVKYPDIRVSFNMLNMQTNPVDVELKSFEPYHEAETIDIKFDIEPYFIEYTNGMEIFWSYKKAFFNPDTIEYIAGVYSDLLTEITESKDVK